MQGSWIFRKLKEIALRKNKQGAVKSSSNSNGNVLGEGRLGLGLKFVKYKRALRRKRLFSGSKIRDSTKNRQETLMTSRKLEALPQDILVSIISKVEHEDLKQLSNVSKTIRNATLIAKEDFKNTTPRKTLAGLDSMIDSGFKVEAPLRKKYGFSRIICAKKISKITRTLFK